MREKLPIQGRDHRLRGVDPIPTGTWHYVGETDEPAFENGSNGDDPLRFRLDNEGNLTIEGDPVVDPGVTIFTLPAWARPSTDKGNEVMLQVLATGEVSIIDTIDGGSP